MNDAGALGPAEGFIEPAVRDEFPGLRLHWLTAPGRRRESPRALVQRLRALSSRYRGASVVAMRTKPIPQAYRAFFRQIGLDPDVRWIPSEEVAVNRLLHGGFRPVDLITDACLVAVIETGVPVWAIDADAVDEHGLGIRTASEADRETALHRGEYLEPGTLVVADGSRVHGLVFGEPATAISRTTERVALFSIAVDGVPAIHVQEALWMCVEELH